MTTGTDSIKSAVTTTGNAISNAAGASGTNSVDKALVSASSFVTSLWTKNANDTLKTTDVYADPNSGVISDRPAKLTSLSSIRSSLKSAKAMLKEVKTVINDVNALKTALTTGSILDRIVKGSSLLKSSLAEAGISADDVAKYANTANTLRINVNGVIKVIKNTNWDNLSQSARLIESLTGITGLHAIADLTTEVGVGVIAIKKYLNAGGDDAATYDAIKATLSGPDGEHQLVTHILPTVIQTSALATLRRINESLGKGRLMGLHPTVIREFSAAFSLPITKSVPELQAHYAMLMTVYYEIDPKWNTTTRNGVVIPNLTNAIAGNEVFKAFVRSNCRVVPLSSTAKVQPAEVRLMLAINQSSKTVTSSLGSMFSSTSYIGNSVVREGN